MKRLNFGCGKKIWKGWDNVDMQDDPRLTASFDFDVYPYPLKENYYDHILISQVIEHILYPEKMLLELGKCCKDDATIRVETAHYSNKGAYNSLQHLHFVNEKAFRNFVTADSLIVDNNRFEIKELITTPTIVGKFIPCWVRNVLSLFIGGLHSQIHCTYIIHKKEGGRVYKE